MLLNRCGASRNKPFCDGTHFGKRFKDDENYPPPGNNASYFSKVITFS
jgi:CDGSH-type Zn-finger protein